MITFDTSMAIAKQIIQSWAEYSSLSEVTIIRDVYGRLAFLFCGQEIMDKSNLENRLDSQLGLYSSHRFFWDGASEYNDLTQQILVEIKKLRLETDPGPTCKWYLLERTVAKKAWLDCTGGLDPIWSYREASEGQKPKIVTFYSFKGGMGRSTALAATALILAKHGRHVLCVDTDVEAPGLAAMFFPEDQIKLGTVDFYLESAANGNTPIVDMEPYLMGIDEPLLQEDLSGSIYIISAGNVDEHYVQKLGRIDYQDTIPDGMRSHLTNLVESAEKYMRDRGCPLDYILLDARAGFHDMGGIVTAQLPHGVMLFGRNNAQSWNGLKHVIHLLATAQKDPLPIAIVSSISGTSAEQRQSFKYQAYTLCCEQYYSESEPVPGIDAEDEAHTPIYVSYTPALNEEIKLYSDGSEAQNRRVEQEKSILCSPEYQEIEKRIRQWFGDEQAEEETYGNR